MRLEPSPLVPLPQGEGVPERSSDSEVPETQNAATAAESNTGVGGVSSYFILLKSAWISWSILCSIVESGVFSPHTGFAALAVP